MFAHIKAARQEAKSHGAEFIILDKNGHVKAAISYRGYSASFVLPASPANKHNAIIRSQVYVRHAIEEIKNKIKGENNPNLLTRSRRQGRIMAVRKDATT